MVAFRTVESQHSERITNVSLPEESFLETTHEARTTVDLTEDQ